MSIYYKANSDGGKTTCKYYKACGNTENCKRCGSYEKSKVEVIQNDTSGNA